MKHFIAIQDTVSNFFYLFLQSRDFETVFFKTPVMSLLKKNQTKNKRLLLLHCLCFVGVGVSLYTLAVRRVRDVSNFYNFP